MFSKEITFVCMCTIVCGVVKLEILRLTEAFFSRAVVCDCMGYLCVCLCVCACMRTCGLFTYLFCCCFADFYQLPQLTELGYREEQQQQQKTRLEINNKKKTIINIYRNKDELKCAKLINVIMPIHIIFSIST